MAALPLTLETLQSPSKEGLSPQSPLLTPTSLKADTSNQLLATATETPTPQRPANLTLDSIQQQQQQQQQQLQQQHSNLTPLSATSTTHGNISPALSSAGSLSPSFLPEMPQWKRDLIQRRKQNVQRTISASSPTTSSSMASAAATALSSSSSLTSPTIAIASGLKTSTSSSSVRSLAGSNTNIDQLASDGLHGSTKDYNNKTSLSSNTNTTAKVVVANKQQQYVTTVAPAIVTTLPASTSIKSSSATATTTITKSPNKEKKEKLFGGQYTATTETLFTTTKEEITSDAHLHDTSIQNKEEDKEKPENVMVEKEIQEEEEEEAIAEHFDEMYRKTKELNDEETTQQTYNKHIMATRLTGSTKTHTTNTALNQRAETESEQEILVNTIQIQQEKNNHNQYNNININIITTGANVNLQNQSLNKCESERLVCAANNTGNSNYNNKHNNNTTNINCGSSISSNSGSSVTIGGISGSVSNNQNNTVVKISQKLQENQFIKNEQQQKQQHQQQYTKKFIKFKQNTLDLKSPTKINKKPTLLTSSASTSCLATTTSPSSSSSAILSATNCAIKKKMVAVQEMKKSTQQNSATHLHPITSTCNNGQQQNNRAGVNGGGGGVGGNNTTTSTDLDNSEDLSYGPGIVSKLRCRYLSLALRESMEQQRLNKDKLRRSTSLNNLLDNTEDEENCEDDDDEEELELELEEEQELSDKKDQQQNLVNNLANNKKAGILKTSTHHNTDKRFNHQHHHHHHNTQGSNGVGVTFTETSFNKRSRHLKRGNDSLKRARSVEALLSEKSPWQCRMVNNNTTTLNTTTSSSNVVTIEDKIYNARERLQLGTDHLPPKRLTSIIDDTERPPPDLVKQTLKMFEATANRRPRSANRSNSKGDVASKVETFKNIIKEQKPLVAYPKPLSPTKKLQQQQQSPTIMQKPLKSSTDLLQTPLGRKTMATITAAEGAGLTPLKTNISSGSSLLSDHTPDIIPRQIQYNNDNTRERDFKQNKEKFSIDCSSPSLSLLKRDLKEKYEVDSPVTALTKELNKLKINDNSSSTSSSSGMGMSRKIDNFNSDNQELQQNNVGAGGGGVGGGAGDNNGDACQRHKYLYNNDFINEETNNSLKNENDKIIKLKQINNETTTTTIQSSSTTTANELTNEATVNNYDCLTKASSPPLSSSSGSSDLSDGGENDDRDVYGGLKTTKRITRTALDNIAKAGFTQQFQFNTNTTNTSSTANASNLSTSSTTSSNHSLALNTGKQIGVIRPLLNTQQQQQQQQQKSTDNMETLKHSTTTSLTSREIEKNRINDLKKSSTSNNSSSSSSSSPNNTTTSCSPTASLDSVIKSPHNTSAVNTSLATSAAVNVVSSTASSSSSSSSSGFSDVDTVISATNSPLWAMRKRRQTPPAAPAENTSMVFNFSNRKEVPDYIENDGVIFRRKRELPKPNESGFVLLGDLSVETSTDMDYDDFSMCPPSPCDVEFVNANIVIDGKSSIRQKSKDTTFHVQFNDTLTSTFEYPSEASLIVDESFSAYNEGYTQPLGSSTSNDFTQAFQNLCLENCGATSTTTGHPIHHVADEIIQLPTLNASSPANATPTKNILGNLPLDVI